MKIRKISLRHRNDFAADMECEHCGHVQRSGYRDGYGYYDDVIPGMHCDSCGKNRAGETAPKAPAVSEPAFERCPHGVDTAVRCESCELPALTERESRLAPTHYCKVCGVRWRQCDDGSWNMGYGEGGKCCRDVPMGGQIATLASATPSEPIAGTAADGKTEFFSIPGYPLMVRAVDFNAALTAPQAKSAHPTAEQRQRVWANAIAAPERIPSAEAWVRLPTFEQYKYLKAGHPHPLIVTPAPAPEAPAVARTLEETEWTDADLWAEIWRLRAAVQGPTGYASWQEAATEERIRRVKAERVAILAAPPTPEAPAVSEAHWQRRGMLVREILSESETLDGVTRLSPGHFKALAAVYKEIATTSPAPEVAK